MFFRRQDPVASTRDGIVSFAALAALVGSLLVAPPASALTAAEIPTDPAAWAATPYSPLAWTDVPAAGNAAALTFDAEAGQLIDAAGVGTGFTSVLPSTATATSPYYTPADLSIAAGKLSIGASNGISTSTVNSQDNALGVGIAVGVEAITLTTSFVMPAGVSGFAQGGLWLGINDSNYIKLAVIANGTSARQFQLAKEVANRSVTPVAPATTSADQVVLGTTASALGTAPITLSMTLNPSTAVATAKYQIGSAAPVDLGSVSGVPASFFNGTAVAGSKPSAVDVDTFGGIFATKRNMPATTPVTFTFDTFGLSAGTAPTPGDTTPPAAPTAVAATAGDRVVDLSWTASTSGDTAGYRVFRGLQPGVSTSATPVSGPTLVTASTFRDTTVSNGTTYYYAVVAADTSANTSAASNEVIAAPRAANTTSVKIDFTKTNGIPEPGYFADWGQSYGSRTVSTQGSGAYTYGWTDTEGNLASLVGNGRDRNRAGIDPLVDSTIHMQYGDVAGGTGTSGVLTEGLWELAVPDGLYSVTYAVGDMPNGTKYDSTNVINVEGTVGIERFVGSATKEYETHTATVGVWDGKLTIDAKDGINTKLGYIEVTSVPVAPHVDTVLPENRLVGHDITAGVSATIKTPFAGSGVLASSLTGNVHLYHAATNVEVPTTVGTSGGNDVISLSPNASLAANTTYRFVVTSGVKDGQGTAFKPFASLFTTGSGVTTGAVGFTPAKNIAFEKIELPTGAGKYWTSFAFGPDGRLYGSTVGQGIWRFTVNTDGTLGTPEDLGHAGVTIIGLLFDKSATASNLKLWVTKTTASFSEQGQWVSTVHQLSGPNLEIDRTIFKGLPRSLADHLTNSMAYGPDGRIYFNQGSNQGAGDLDNAWGQRGEQKLSAATLVFDPANTQVSAAAAGGTTTDVQTAGGGTYDPYATNAPLKIYASGIRNAYDLVWHSNGRLYVATNGTAGGANTPGVIQNADGTYTRDAADGIPGFSTVDGRDVTEQCVRRGYTGGTVPPTANIPTQRDLLFDVQEGKYYGHPNPERCEFVLNGGNDPATPAAPGTKESKYASGQKADPNYGGVAFDFEFNKSPNGALEYKSSTFGGQLKGRLVIARFSNNNDLIFIEPSPTTGKILGGQTSIGITGDPSTAMTGVDGFNDPLEVVEDTRNGNLYVNQYDRAGSEQKLFLLRVPASQQASAVSASTGSVIFSAVKATTSGVKSVVVRNNTAQTVTLQTALTGGQTGEFAVTNGSGTIATGSTRTVSVTFTPANTAGQRSTTMRFTAGSSTVDVGLYGLSMDGIEGLSEPPLIDVLGTLGYAVNPGWADLAGGTGPAAKGDEVLDPLFIKAGTSAPTITPVAQYAPEEEIPFGWYTGAGAAGDRNLIGTIDISGYQSLLPPVTLGSSSTFDPGANTFGLYYYSNKLQRFGYTEDGLNTGIAHRARIYPAKDRAGIAIPDTFIVAFEEASNGDYQDYVFVVSGIKPAAQTGGAGVRVDFTTKAGGLAAGYLRDYGQPFGARSDTDQGTGLNFGWRNETTLAAVDIATGGTSGTGNGRDRNSAQPDQRLDSFMHMQTAAAGSTFNGTKVNALWDLQVANGQYDVTVAVGDPVPQTGTEVHQINVEGVTAIAGFIPSGTAGAATRHLTATKRVTVADGELTIDARGGTNTKLSFIDVIPVTVTPDADPTNGAQVKVRFQTDGIPTPDGWTADAGGAYSTAAGFGWIDGTTVQPTDRASAIVYRSTATSGIAYPSSPLQKGVASLQQPTGAFWERAVPNGTYEVMVSAGDSAQTDSLHTVTAEGQPVISGFTPTGATPFQTGKRTITINDGRLTIAGSGENTKINWVSLKGTGLGGPPPTTATVNFDFSTSDAPVPADWLRETGAAYADTTGYGWLANGTPSDRTAFSRYRTVARSGIAFPSDPTLRTFHQMQSGTSTNVLNGVWEYAVPNGTYRVTATVGDANYLDSSHGVSADGIALVAGFVPIASTPFATGSKDVVVRDGKLTLSPTGTNTKVASITIVGVGIGAPILTVAAGGATIGANYIGPATSVTLTGQASGGALVSSIAYTLNGGASTTYSAPLTIDTLGVSTLVVSVTDSVGRTTTRTMTFTIQSVGGTVKLRNEQVSRVNGAPMPGFYEDWLVMGRINTATIDHKVMDSATVTVINTDTRPLQISGLTITGTNAADFVVTTPTGAMTVAAGASIPVAVKFVSITGIRGVRSAQLNVASSDPASPTTIVQLRGQYMLKPEGADEPSLDMLRQLWGWQTNVGDTNNGDEMRTSALNGDEVRSLLWKRADAALPVVARQIAAYHGCCIQTASIKLSGTAQAVHAGPWAQSIFPLQADGNPTELRVSPTTTFGITVSGQTTNNVNYMAVKTWPVKGRDGKIVPNAWFVGFDYISTPNQCGIAPTNCDFQDNVYLVTNILPVASNDSTAPAAPTNPTATITGSSVRVGWTAVSSTGLGGYHVERAVSAAGPWTRLTNQAVSATSYVDSGLPIVSTLFYRVLSTDPSGNVSPASPGVSVGVSALPRTMLIKAGGPATTVNGRTWEADTPYVTGGRLYTNPRISDIFRTDDDGLYWSERSEATTFGYNIPLADGSYTVRLHFAEPYFGATGGGAGGTGKRVFDVNFEEGAKEIVGLDLNAMVPPMTAYIDTRTVTVIGGNLDIDFAATTNFPSVSAIEIIPN